MHERPPDFTDDRRFYLKCARKIPYETEAKAWSHIRQMKGVRKRSKGHRIVSKRDQERLVAYHCQYCDKWHVGSKP